MVRHMMISKVRGRFREFDGTIVIAVRPEDSRTELFIDAASIDTRDATRDEHLRSADFLDVEHHPEIKFTSTSIRPGEIGHWDMTGDLTVRDVTRQVLLDVEFTGATIDPWGNLRAGFNASTRLDRDQFGITWNQALEAGCSRTGRRSVRWRGDHVIGDARGSRTLSRHESRRRHGPSFDVTPPGDIPLARSRSDFRVRCQNL
jgi:polyisoprenoid-binding protein YceI